MSVDIKTDFIGDLLKSLPPNDIVTALLKSMPAIDLLRIVDMPEAQYLSSLSEDTLVREHPDKIVKLSKRRNGVRVIHALMLSPNI
jgi:hypothetical protein